VTVVLGIDAAWTPHGSSGIALLTADPGRSAIVATARSYREFVDRANGIEVNDKPQQGSEPCVRCVLSAAHTLAGAPVDVVAVDMPMWTKPGNVNVRRCADNAISREFGRHKASVHSPTQTRPGDVGRRITTAFAAAGYPLVTAQRDAARTPALIEVFPLAALVRLLRADERPKYKIGKIARHYPRTCYATRAEQIAALLATWQTIVVGLTREIDSIGFAVTADDFSSNGAHLKPREDVLDAIVCAWIGLCYARGRIQAFADGANTAAIWIPTMEEP
jgi:predicted RNase H-like nuclease